MKAIRSLGNGLMLEAEGSTQVELFTALADLDKSSEVFGEWKCGCCGSEHISFSYRDVEYQEKDKKTGELLFITGGKDKGKPKMTTSRYFEMVCKNGKCRARKSFGQNREGGGLFPKNKSNTKNAEGGYDYLPNYGWQVFKSKNSKPTDAEEGDAGENMEESAPSGDEKPF